MKGIRSNANSGKPSKHHGLGRCRYAIQAYLTAIALNLKRLVRSVTGVPFKGKVPIMA